MLAVLITPCCDDVDDKMLLLLLLLLLMMMMIMMQYKTEKDGVIETRIEKRLVLTGTAADVDHDKVNTTVLQQS